MTRRPAQARGEARRRQVLEATLRLLAGGGPRAVTHRAVAREAGTSVRATTYYFDSREELLVEALRHYAATARERFDALQSTLPHLSELASPVAATMLRAAAEVLADIVLSDLGDGRSGLLAEYELVLETARTQALESEYRAWQRSLEDMLSAYARAFGSSDPSLDARVALATLRGLELEALARPSVPADRADLTRVFHRLLQGMVTVSTGEPSSR